MRNPIGVRGRTIAVAALLIWPAPSLLAHDHRVTSGERRSATFQADKTTAGKVVEIRSYNLKPGTRERFHQLFLREALPMLQRWKVDVVAYGPSLHDNDSYYLMRAYSSVEDRQRSEDAFYGSDEWKQGPREAILACIDTYATVVLQLDDAALQSLRRLP